MGGRLTDPGGASLPDEIAAIRREFAAGLPDRVAALSAAVVELRRGFAREAAETLYLKAHALRGTAASFGADELVPAATALAAAGRRWLDARAVPANDAAAAAREVERLADAVTQFRARPGNAR